MKMKPLLEVADEIMKDINEAKKMTDECNTTHPVFHINKVPFGTAEDDIENGNALCNIPLPYLFTILQWIESGFTRFKLISKIQVNVDILLKDKWQKVKVIDMTNSKKEEVKTECSYWVYIEEKPVDLGFKVRFGD